MVNPVNNYIDGINARAQWVDTQFNRVNSIPIVGAFSSSVYAAASVVHFSVAAMFSIVGFAGQLAQGKESNWKLVADAGSEHMQHAALNYVSAMGTGFLAGSIIGFVPLAGYHVSQLENISTLKAKKNGFKPVINYATPVTAQMKELKTRIAGTLAPIFSLVSSARKAS